MRSDHQPRDPSAVTPPLSIVQRWFEAVVTHPEGVAAGVESTNAQALVPMTRDQLEQMITRSRSLSAHDRLTIYANAYYARLIECLGDSFPVLKHTLGEEVFNQFAFGYLQQYPSRSYTLNRLGERFAQYLDETRPTRETESTAEGRPDARPSADWADFLIDLATLEWTINEVFDGPGLERAPPLDLNDVQATDAHDLQDVRVVTAPCLRLLRLRFDLNAYYSATRRNDSAAVPPIDNPRELYLAITRRDYIVRRHELSRAQYQLVDALQQGRSLPEAIARAASETDWDDEELARSLEQWFKTWTAACFFQRIVYLIPR